MTFNNMKTGKPINNFASNIYTPDEVCIINNLLAYMSEIKNFSAKLLAESPSIKFEPHLQDKKKGEEHDSQYR